MAERVCIYTAISGGFDDLKPQPTQTIECDFICFADEPGRVVAPPWRVVALPPRPGDPRYAAKLPKVDPHGEGDLLAGYDVTIWIDGSVVLLRPEFAERMVAALGTSGIAALPHPERNSIYDEAEAASAPELAHKYAGQPRREQVEHYRMQGLPDSHHLFAGGVLVRNMRDPAVREVGAAWRREIERWSLHDHLSLPFVLWACGVRCEPIALHLWRNPLFEVWPHLDPVGGDLARRASPEFDMSSFRDRAAGMGVGIYDPESARWRIRQPDGTDLELSFGPAGRGLVPLIGDWDGDGACSPGLYDPATATFFLRNECSDGPADHAFVFGRPGALPVAGDWDGDGRDSVGIFLPSSGMWSLTNRHAPGAADLELSFGAPGTGSRPVAGDWDGRGRDRVGLYEPEHATWFLLHELGTGEEVTTFSFGRERALPVVGDWNADGADEVGTYVPEQGMLLLARANRSGSACLRLVLDPPGGRAVAGAWGRSTTGAEPIHAAETVDLRNRSTSGIPERILPEDLPLAPDHVARYLFAAHWAAGCRVLDLCCGVGYGTALLASAGARRVLGVDVDPAVVEFARGRYRAEAVEFVAADAAGDLPLVRAELVTCFEGLEHVDRPEALLANVARSLVPRGVAIVSSPNGAFYPGGFSGNPHHVKEYTLAELTALLAPYFGTVELYAQFPATTGPGTDHVDQRTLEDAYRLRPRRWTSVSDVPRSEPIVWVAVCRDPIAPPVAGSRE